MIIRNYPFPWWEWRPSRRRLAVRVYAHLAGLPRRYRFLMARRAEEDAEVGWCDDGTIFINPPRLHDEVVAKHTDGSWATSWQWSWAMAAHEIGHAHYTGDPAESKILHHVANILEDERIERAMARRVAGLERLFDQVGSAFWEENAPLTGDEPWRVIGACLLWRWEHDHPERPSKIRLSGQAAALWDDVRPIAEGAWVAETYDDVVQAARQILQRLNIPLNQRLDLPWILGFGGAGTGEGLSIPSGGGTAGGDGPGGDGPGPPPPVSGGPYMDVEQEIAPAADRLIELLRLKPQEARWRRSETHGRYNFRQSRRTPDEPYREYVPRCEPPPLSLGLALDVSSSMSAWTWPLRRLGVMMARVAGELDIPLYMGAFNSDRAVLIRPDQTRPADYERAKGMAANLRTYGGTRPVALLEDMVKAMPAGGLRFGLMACDGFPAVSEEAAVRVLFGTHDWLYGTFIGQMTGDARAKMEYLTCGRLLHAPDVDGLAVQLGQVIRSLRRR